MPQFYPKPEGQAAHRGRSRNLWADCPYDEIRQDYAAGYYLRDDFMNTPTLSADADTDQYATYIDTGGTILPLATELGGVLRLTIDATGDNEETWLTTGGNVGNMCKISDTAGENFKLWFECRIRLGQVTAQNFYCGLGEEALATADAVFTDADAIADKDLVGFRILAADPDGLDAIHGISSTSGETVVANEAQVVVAATWYKLGIRFDGTKIEYWIDNVLQNPTTTVLPSTTNFPDNEELSFVMGGKAGGATAHTFDLDWFELFVEQRVTI